MRIGWTAKTNTEPGGINRSICVIDNANSLICGHGDRWRAAKEWPTIDDKSGRRSRTAVTGLCSPFTQSV
jgi:hypothetical protein